MPEREQILDIGGMIGQRLYSRHILEVERRRLIGELISIDRDLRGEDFIQSSLVTNSGVGSDPIPGQLRALEGAERIDGQNFRCGSVRKRWRGIGRVDVVQILLRGWRGAKRVVRVGEVLRDRQAEVRLIRRVAVDQGNVAESAAGEERQRLIWYDLAVHQTSPRYEFSLSACRACELLNPGRLEIAQALGYVRTGA